VREDFENYDGAEEPLLRGSLDREDEPDVGQALLEAVRAEFRESATEPDVPLS
jgi:hypothetical protein